MKKYFIAFTVLSIVATVQPARADKPIFTQPQFTTIIECDNEVSYDENSGQIKIECEPEDLKTYPFLADLTKEPTAEDSSFEFHIARVESKNLPQPVLVVSMYNETIYTSPWGSAGAYAINANGTYTPQWLVNGGTVAYTADCPKKFSYIIKGNEKSTYGEWVYDGKNIVRVAGYDKLEDFPSCQ